MTEAFPACFCRQELKSLPSGIVFSLAQEILSRGASFRFCARGVSMRPFIHDGDVLTISPLFAESPGIGEVVAFIHNGKKQITVHRVIKIKNGCFFLQGDAMPEADGWIPRENILGRVIKVERSGRTIHFGMGLERMAIAFFRRKQTFWKSLRMAGRLLRKLGWNI